MNSQRTNVLQGATSEAAKMLSLQYRLKVSWQSLLSLDSRLDPRYSIPASFKHRGLRLSYWESSRGSHLARSEIMSLTLDWSLDRPLEQIGDHILKRNFSYSKERKRCKSSRSVRDMFLNVIQPLWQMGRFAEINAWERTEWPGTDHTTTVSRNK